jgi:hypothetical protein
MRRFKNVDIGTVVEFARGWNLLLGGEIPV